MKSNNLDLQINRRNQPLCEDKHHNNNLHILNKILHALNNLVEMQKDEFEWFKSQEFITNQYLKQSETKIMSKISEFSDRQNAFNDKLDAAVVGITGDIKSLNDLIVTLQNSPGTVTPEDQALLDQIEARSSAVVTKIEALDALTPPPAPLNI